MNNKCILITGANGQLAKSITSKLIGNILFLGNKKTLDVTNRGQVMREVKKFKPDIILHFASMTRGDECALNPKKAFLINVEGTRNVSDAARDVNALLLFVSTNEVFDGMKKSPYSEKDMPNPITVVDKTKYEAEIIIKDKLKKYFIVRTSWLYSKWSFNFIYTILEKARENNKIELVNDEISSPTYSLDLADAIIKLIATNKYGVYHLTNEGFVSRLEFARLAFNLQGISPRIKSIKLKDFKRHSTPPQFTPLESKKISELGINMPRWEDALKRYLKENKL